jgi:hypothetical protein
MWRITYPSDVVRHYRWYCTAQLAAWIWFRFHPNGVLWIEEGERQ